MVSLVKRIIRERPTIKANFKQKSLKYISSLQGGSFIFMEYKNKFARLIRIETNNFITADNG